MARIISMCSALALALVSAIPAAAQPPKTPDFNGLWDGVKPTGDLARALPAGQKIPFTPFGLEKYKNVDMATNPNGMCLPPGPSRSITGPSPFQIVQSPGIVAILFENHFDYRIVYIDGTHPADIADYPAFMGHSIGKWDGDKLVVDTVAINDRTWLDSNGLQHSDKLHLTETFRKTGPDMIHYAVTFDDPVYFTRPWTFDLDLKRQKKGDRIMEYVCEENEKDFKTLRPTTRKVSE
jgi:hypothetical protein